MMNTAFSRFKNTADDPVLLDKMTVFQSLPGILLTTKNHSKFDQTRWMWLWIQESQLKPSTKSTTVDQSVIHFHALFNNSWLHVLLNSSLHEDYRYSWGMDSLTNIQSPLLLIGNKSTSVGGLGSDEAKASGKGRKRKGVELLVKDLTMKTHVSLCT
ncbi:hypothetical protein L6452_30892 [Arctium lappa]|uniref:Uncharacterized protein n=1 Tax=Arctium lappa TaxID=4217 RepID=A0ACB8ZNU3_ARCLA|nr:hypothetical protein L6452_30892 [Arctium lappa]